MNPDTITILIVDDDEVDTEAVVRALRKAKIANPIERAHDGIAGLEMLRGSAGQPILKKPYIILLDINMPRMNGIEFLNEMRNDEQLEGTVVFMLTTSEDERDITEAYTQHVAGYIVKQNAGEDFLRLINMLDNYWRVVELPTDNT